MCVRGGEERWREKEITRDRATEGGREEGERGDGERGAAAVASFFSLVAAAGAGTGAASAAFSSAGAGADVATASSFYSCFVAAVTGAGTALSSPRRQNLALLSASCPGCPGNRHVSPQIEDALGAAAPSVLSALSFVG